MDDLKKKAIEAKTALEEAKVATEKSEEEKQQLQTDFDNSMIAWKAEIDKLEQKTDRSNDEILQLKVNKTEYRNIQDLLSTEKKETYALVAETQQATDALKDAIGEDAITTLEAYKDKPRPKMTDIDPNFGGYINAIQIIVTQLGASSLLGDSKDANKSADILGPRTKAGVKTIQNYLNTTYPETKLVSDGIPGPLTISALLAPVSADDSRSRLEKMLAEKPTLTLVEPVYSTGNTSPTTKRHENDTIPVAGIDAASADKVKKEKEITTALAKKEARANIEKYNLTIVPEDGYAFVSNGGMFNIPYMNGGRTDYNTYKSKGIPYKSEAPSIGKDYKPLSLEEAKKDPDKYHLKLQPKAGYKRINEKDPNNFKTQKVEQELTSEQLSEFSKKLKDYLGDASRTAADLGFTTDELSQNPNIIRFFDNFMNKDIEFKKIKIINKEKIEVFFDRLGLSDKENKINNNISKNTKGYHLSSKPYRLENGEINETLLKQDIKNLIIRIIHRIDPVQQVTTTNQPVGVTPLVTPQPTTTTPTTTTSTGGAKGSL